MGVSWAVFTWFDVVFYRNDICTIKSMSEKQQELVKSEFTLFYKPLVNTHI